MPSQTTINGFPIIDSAWVPRTRQDAQGYVVIVDRGAGSFQRYVASLWFDGEDGWCQGHYCTMLDDARAEARRLVLLYT